MKALVRTTAQTSAPAWEGAASALLDGQGTIVANIPASTTAREMVTAQRESVIALLDSAASTAPRRSVHLAAVGTASASLETVASVTLDMGGWDATSRVVEILRTAQETGSVSTVRACACQVSEAKTARKGTAPTTARVMEFAERGLYVSVLGVGGWMIAHRPCSTGHQYVRPSARTTATSHAAFSSKCPRRSRRESASLTAIPSASLVAPTRNR